MIKDIYHKRSIPYVYNKEILNYELDVDRFEELLEEDIAKALFPSGLVSHTATPSVRPSMSARGLSSSARNTTFSSTLTRLGWARPGFLRNIGLT